MGNYPVNFNPSGYVFGDGFTIFFRLCEIGGHEIHVNSSSPTRKACLKLMNNIGGVWWTSIPPVNKKAINLCLKCGFKYYKEITKINPYNGKEVTMNIYKRCEDVEN